MSSDPTGSCRIPRPFSPDLAALLAAGEASLPVGDLLPARPPEVRLLPASLLVAGKAYVVVRVDWMEVEVGGEVVRGGGWKRAGWAGGMD